MTSKPTVAYLSSGELYVCREGGDPKRFTSPFAAKVRDRSLQIQRRHEWKQKGRGAQFMSGGLLWGGGGEETLVRPAIVNSLCPGDGPNKILYVLDTAEVCGVFSADASGGSDTEERLFHSADVNLAGLARHAQSDWLACALHGQGGNASLALMKHDGSDLREITEGDSVDLAPSWRDSNKILYQSAGIGRDDTGMMTGLSPFSVNELDLQAGEIKTLASSDKQDLLGPRLDREGALYYIRRPYHDAQRGQSFLRAVGDFLLFPLRLLFALFQWLNFFTARYTGKPLTTAGGPDKQGADMRQMMIWGNLINASQAAKDGVRYGEDPPSIVPSSWQLVRQVGEQQQVLAKGVLAFDVCEDGVVFSNGSAIYHLSNDGTRQRLCIGQAIAQVMTLC